MAGSPSSLDRTAGRAPYGQPPQAPQPGYGYPQQAPQGVPPQQPGPYGGQPSYGQQPPYDQQPYGVPQPPTPGGDKKKMGIIIGAVAVVAAIAVGAYFVIGGGGGGSDIADDGAHKLTAPESVLDGEYKQSGSAVQTGSMDDGDIEDFEKWGAKNAENVSAGYQSGSGLSTKSLTFTGVYGTIDDPEAAVDSMFAKMKKESEKDSGDTQGKFVGSPEEVTPSGFENGIMKCQSIEITNADPTNSSSTTPESVRMPMCIWGDHSTVALATAVDVSTFTSGKGGSTDETAELAAKLRNDVRVKA